MKSIEHIKKLISSTPMIVVSYRFRNRIGKVYAKCEWFSLTGSIKDKTAYQILIDAYASHKISRDTPIVEVSSGNMGISLTAIANLLGNPVTIIMPKHMSIERKKLLKLYGATLIETDDFPSAFALCNEYEKSGYFCPHQFENQSNARVHSEITAQEILTQTTNKNIDAFVCGLGTSGTFTGIGRVLKEKSGLKVIAIEQDNARIITSSPPYGKHKLQGLSDEILPKLYDNTICDGVIQIKDNDAIAMAQKLCRELSLGVGISSGANVLGAILSGTNSITILPDDNKKYLSTDLITPTPSQLVDQIELLDMDVIK
jgi:cysteine synthase A